MDAFARTVGRALIMASLCMAPWLARAAAPPTDPAAFVQAATQAGLMQVEAGKVAMNASMNAAVKTFADRMITDHGRSGGELAVIAKKKSFNVPTDLDAAHVKALKDLRAKSAKEFDAAYMALAAEEQARAVALFEANTMNQDEELAAFVALVLPVLKEHQKLANDLKASVGK